MLRFFVLIQDIQFLPFEIIPYIANIVGLFVHTQKKKKKLDLLSRIYVNESLKVRLFCFSPIFCIPYAYCNKTILLEIPDRRDYGWLENLTYL